MPDQSYGTNRQIQPLVFANTGDDAILCTSSPQLSNIGLSVAPSSNGDCAITGTTSSQATSGYNAFTITAQNSGGSDTASVNIKLVSPPSITDLALQTLSVGQQVRLEFTNSGGKADSCQRGIPSSNHPGTPIELSPGLFLRTENGDCVISGIPTSETASVIYTISAYNNTAGSDSAFVSITVNQ